MLNYLGLGLDAKLCYDFHEQRNLNPNQFTSRIGNKYKPIPNLIFRIKYGYMGFTDMFKASQ